MVPTATWMALALALLGIGAAGMIFIRGGERERRRLLERALDALPSPAQIVAGDGRVVYANAPFRQTFDDATLAMPELLRQQVVGDAAGQELTRLAGSEAGGKIELSVATSVGEIGWREVYLRPLPELPHYALWLCRDITVERRARTGLTPLVQALEKPADGATASVPKEADKRLEAQLAQTLRLQAVGQLAGGIAHDFNNLLTAMIGFCDLLLLRHRPGDQSFADVMQIRQNANRAASLVRQLLAYSRQQTLQPRVISLAEVLAELAHLLHRLIGGKIDLKIEHGSDLYPVLVDQGQLEQVVINLAVNARDAMPDGGTLIIRTANASLTQPFAAAGEMMPAGDYVRIDVIDTGTGIPPEIVDRIFEPFFSTKPVGAGTGLGLSTVYGIVRQSGGYIVLDSKMGAGTTFSIYMPRHAQSAVATPRRDGEEEAARDLTGAGTILLVEDEDAVRLFSARALRNKGYKVLEARSGEAALDILSQEGEPVDLLVTDVVMPEMDGPALVERVRGQRPDMKVIFISGYAESAFREQASDGSQLHFLAKPFSLKQLAGKVKDVLEGSV
ncbi:MAG: two-component system, cell cycle sensor histidine kinase and response regulator CckA [Rhodospirillaceae bacterium]|nr:two-component system, cell cycle sensor histidine kinase and response regulator CckA [Rhodospirillaceae bacterium]